MKDLDYLRLNKFQKILHNLKTFIFSLPGKLLNALKALVMMIVNIFKGTGRALYDLVDTYIKGDWKTKVSYTVMGFGSFARGQWLRGILFLVFQTVFNLYIYFFGFAYLSKLSTLGTIESYKMGRTTKYGDNSFLILLYGVLTIFFIVAFIYTWRVNIKQNKLSEQIIKSGKKLKTAKDDVNSMLDGQFHKTLLALPTMGVAIFTILPIIFMILVAFTNYDNTHQPPTTQFQWVGTQNFQTLLTNTESDVTVDVTSNNGKTAFLTITASDGDKLTVNTSELEAAEHAEYLTTLPQADLNKPGSRMEDMTGKAMKAEKHQFSITASQKTAVEFATESAWYSHPEVTLPLMFAEKLTITVYQTEKDEPVVLLEDAQGRLVVLGTSQMAGREINLNDYELLTGDGVKAKQEGIAKGEIDSLTANITTGEKIINRASGSKVKLTLTDDIHANFSLTEIYNENTHALTVAAAGETFVLNGFNYAASSDKVTLEGMKKAEGAKLAFSSSQSGDKWVVTIANENTEVPEFITLTTRDQETLNKIAAAVAAAQAGADQNIYQSMGIAAIPRDYTLEVFSDKGENAQFVVTNLKTVNTPSFSYTFKQVLLWTLIWAFFATFLNYFLGMLVAIMINKKGIKLKKMWRTILVMTIAIPQFISLLYVSKMFAADGLINSALMSLGWIKKPLPFWTDTSWARVTIIGINVWIGIPYLMLIATGILMNIPADLYESARIDGANAFQTYRKITLPYMLFVTGPYLLTSFTGNINNFNVIFLLSQGKPLSMDLAGNAGSTDLLITWLYKMTVTDSNYKLAAVMGILVFVVCAVINLVVYNLIPSVKNEEDFQ